MFKWLDCLNRGYIDRERLIDMVFCRSVMTGNVSLHPLEVLLQQFMLNNSVSKKQLFQILDINYSGVLDHG